VSQASQRRLAGEAADALPLLEKALVLDPNAPLAWAERGLARAMTGDMDGALADLRQARELDTSGLGVYEAIDWVLGEKKRWAEAARCWDPLIAREPRLARAYYRRGASLLRAGDRGRALKDAEAACDLGDAQACEVRNKLKG
jgi:tetratricopeptide (TPR) repeat protein